MDDLRRPALCGLSTESAPYGAPCVCRRRARWRWLVVLGAALVSAAAGRSAADESPDYGECGRLCVQPGGDCTTQPFTSRCYFARAEWDPQTGFPLNLHLGMGFGPPDLPPRSSSVWGSSSPLVPAGALLSPGPTPFQSRAMHNDLIDWATGYPLIQAVDFELPFGGALFRHVRTYSENPADAVRSATFSPDRPAEGTRWDWNGLFWSMSENPILLIDVRYPNMVAAGQKYCYFIPDAHHSIPFVFDENQNKYIAPPWFDATLVDDGLAPPQHYTVVMQRGAVRYTIEAQHEDLTAVEPMVDYHELPHGWPQYGLVTRIEDRNGNRVEYEYCPVGVSACDDPGTSQCQECCENCNEKGQIRRVRLIAAGGSVAWSLLYTHRAFGDPNERGNVVHHDHAVHTIHVYQGDVDAANGACLTLGADEFCGQAGLEAQDAITHTAIPPNWQIEARYLYSPQIRPPWGTGAACLPEPELFSSMTSPGPNLLKTTVTRRADDGTQGSRTTLYRYSFFQATGGVHANSAFQLSAIYEDARIPEVVKLMHDNGVLDHEQPASLYTILRISPFQVIVPNADSGHTKRIEELADVQMNGWTTADGEWAFGPLHPLDAELKQFAGLPVDRTLFNHSGRQWMADRRRNSPQYGGFVYYRFIRYPSSLSGMIDPSNPPGDNTCVPTETLVHYPYRVALPTGGGALAETRLDEPLYVTICDEVKFPNGDVDMDELLFPGPNEYRSRRVVECNSAGFVLRDRTWRPDAGSSTTAERVFEEVRRFDCRGRLIEQRTPGWAAAEAAGQGATQGLVRVFAYQNPACDWDATADACACAGPMTGPGELLAEGIKQGRNGTVYWLRAFERDAYRPELVTRAAEFSVPVLDPSSTSGAEVTTTSYMFGSEREVLERCVVRPAAPRTAGGPSYYAVEKTRFGAGGQMQWQASGTMQNPAALQAGDELFLNYIDLDPIGRPLYRVDDYDPNAPGVHPEWPNAPPGFARQAGSAGLNYLTTFEFPAVFGHTRTVLPSGREMRVEYSQVGGDLLKWTFNDVVMPGTAANPSAQFRVATPVKVERSHGSKLLETREFYLTATDDLPDGYGAEANSANQHLLSISVPQYDSAGRMVGASQTGADGSALSAATSYNGFGLLERELGVDGTIRRYTYDSLGRLEKTYVGSKDQHEFWHTAVRCDDKGEPSGCVSANEPFPDDLVLLEKRSYGIGVHDANELVRVRHYRGRPQNQYSETALPGEPNPPPNNEDEVGWTTDYRMDWRMRVVCTIQRDSAGVALTHSVSWYDNLDRVVLSAEYDAQPPPAEIDPALRAPGSIPPSAAQILAATPCPTALQETLRDARGNAVETRDYDVGSGTAPRYTVTQQFFDHRGLAVEVRAPNAPVRRSVYDGRGRRVRSLTLAGGLELSRVDSAYDGSDHELRTTTRERRAGAGGSAIDDDNSVASYLDRWYDDAGRLVALANYGTNSADNTFSTGPAPPLAAQPGAPGYDPNHPPMTRGPDGRLCGCNFGELASIAPQAELTCYEFDAAGRQTMVYLPDGYRRTQSIYDDLGRLRRTVENPHATDASERRETRYGYDTAGRLEEIVAADGSGSAVQATRLVYGADVVSGSFATESAAPGLVRAIHFPDPATGQPSDKRIIQFAYHPDGMVAMRTDARGVVLRYRYDELGRQREILVDDSTCYPDGQPGAETYPPDRVRRVTLDHQPTSGALTQATAFSQPPSATPPEGNAVLADVHLDYDSRVHLVREVQQHRGFTTIGQSPDVTYAWEYSPAVTGRNFERLASIQYPYSPVLGRYLDVNYSYGAPGSADDGANRVTALTTILSDPFAGGAGVGQGVALALATYSYGGVSRRTGLALGNGVSETWEPSGATLDRFGRMARLEYRDAAGAVLQRFEYGYDKNGERVTERVAQLTPGGTLVQNAESRLHKFDALGRLIETDIGAIDTGTSQIDVTPGAVLSWGLDSVGNWAGRPSFRRVENDASGATSTLEVSHSIDHANEIAAIESNQAATASLLWDACGNLVFDGQYVYQYDAWSRLVQVNHAAGPLPDPLAQMQGVETGVVLPAYVGDLVVRYVYDGFGRLVEKTTPIERHGPTVLRTKAFYYDGVRRIQEVLIEPVEGEFDTIFFLDEWDGGTSNTELPGEGGTGPQEIITSSGSFLAWVDREYVWGTGETDELVCQFDKLGRAMYVIQDAGGDVTGLLDDTGSLVEQISYEPYGAVRWAESYSPHPVSRVGHKGLFFERFDGSVSDPALSPESAGLYYVRNRFYSAALGRFLTPDPNETALPIVSAAAAQGQAIAIVAGALDATGLYSDGVNLYQYLRGNPLNGRDALGLYDDYDDAIASYFGDRAAMADLISSSIQTSINVGAMVGQMALSVMPGGGAALTLIQLAAGKISVQDALIAGAWGVAGFGAGYAAEWMLGRIITKFLATSSRTRAASRTVSLTHMIIQDLCFVAGTLVLTADGMPRPIEAICPGEAVWCDADPEAANGPEIGYVAAVIERTAPAVLELSLETDGATCSITTTPEHPFFVPRLKRYVPAGELEIGELLGEGGGVARLAGKARRAGPRAVFNLEVAGGHSYFVSPRPGLRLLVHNECVGHHVIPKEILRQLPEDITRAGSLVRGARGSPNIWDVPKKLHKAIHNGWGCERYNVQWVTELKAEFGPHWRKLATEEGVLKVRDRMVELYRLEPFRKGLP
ncbi:MAG: polymorphic toxin-type HINT domain-containing protein [Phycisphaerae bacterium]